MPRRRRTFYDDDVVGHINKVIVTHNTIYTTTYLYSYLIPTTPFVVKNNQKNYLSHHGMVGLVVGGQPIFLMLLALALA